jgi:hypothetical protein
LRIKLWPRRERPRPGPPAVRVAAAPDTAAARFAIACTHTFPVAACSACVVAGAEHPELADAALARAGVTYAEKAEYRRLVAEFKAQAQRVVLQQAQLGPPPSAVAAAMLAEVRHELVVPPPMEAPRDAAVLAWRLWRTRHAGGHEVLASYGKEDLWLPRVQARAYCHLNAYGSSHQAPFFGCHCGLYGLKSISSMLERMDSLARNDVFGLVSFWGHVVEADFGYKAEFAYPSALFVFSGLDVYRARDLADHLRALYAVPALVLGSRLFDPMDPPAGPPVRTQLYAHEIQRAIHRLIQREELEPILPDILFA